MPRLTAERKMAITLMPGSVAAVARMFGVARMTVYRLGGGIRMSKLTPEQIREIRRSKLSHMAMAKRVRRDESTVAHIRAGRRYRYVAVDGEQTDTKPAAIEKAVAMPMGGRLRQENEFQGRLR